MPEGLMAVRFKCSDNGRPRSVQISMHSGNADFDASGRQMIASIKNLHPLPAGVGHDQVFEATIQVAGSLAEYNHQLARWHQHQILARAASQQATVLAIGPVSELRG
jgi:hypothetical protein